MHFRKVEDFADAIAYMASNRAFYRAVSTNNLMDVKKYNWDTIASQFKEIYRKVQHENFS